MEPTDLRELLRLLAEIEICASDMGPRGIDAMDRARTILGKYAELEDSADGARAGYKRCSCGEWVNSPKCQWNHANEK